MTEVSPEHKMRLISEKEYDAIQGRLEWLAALEAAGVDSWSGWDYAISILNEGEENDCE